jgi:hypothetical protein
MKIKVGDTVILARPELDAGRIASISRYLSAPPYGGKVYTVESFDAEAGDPGAYINIKGILVKSLIRKECFDLFVPKELIKTTEVFL